MSLAQEKKQEPVDPFVRKLLVGDPVYVDDVRVKERVAYFGLVRSSYANARIRKVDFSKIAGNKEFVDFISGHDLKKQGIDPIPVQIEGGKQQITYSYLASDKVSYVGEPIAAVLCSNMYSVEDLIDQVDVEYDALEPVSTMEMSKTSGTLVHDALKDNLLFSTRIIRDQEGTGKMNATNEEKSDTRNKTLNRVRANFRVNREAAAPVEARSNISTYDRATDSFIVYATVQDLNVLESLLSRALRVEPNKIKVRKSSLGGTYGAKGTMPYPEAVLSCLFARRNPDFAIKWVSTRTEDLTETVQGRDKRCEIELGCDNSGKIMELKAKIDADVGVFEISPDGNPSVLNTAKLLPGVYNIPSIDIEVACYATNKTPSGPVKDVGKAEACFFIERAIDNVSRRLRMDPLEFRKRNLIKPEEFPYDNGCGFVYDSGNFSSLLQNLLQVSDYEALKAWRERINYEYLKEISKNESRKLAGIGISLAIEDNMITVKSKNASEVSPRKVKTFPSGAHLCALLVDTETGTVEIEKYVVVDDYGTALNVAFAEGRVHGGLGREIGAALLEEVLYDDFAQPLSSSFMSYLIPTAETVPNVLSVHRETPSPLTENGSKGLGEIGTIGVMAAVSNALSDAISYVVGDGTIDTLPAGPEVIKKILKRPK